MNHPGSNSFLQRVVKKALPTARFIVGQKSPDYHTHSIPKTIGHEGHGATPRSARTPHHLSHWYMVTPESQPIVGRDSHEHTPREPPQSYRSCAGPLSIQTQRHSTDAPPSETFNWDKFIRENETWAPPSPREVLSRRQFREARQASNMKPPPTINQPPSDYLVRRPMKG